MIERDMVTQRDVQGVIRSVMEQGGTVSAVLVARRYWWEFMDDMLGAQIRSPTLAFVWGIPVMPTDELPEDGRVRTLP